MWGAKNISTLDFRRTRRLNESLTNDFVKPTMLWTTGPWCLNIHDFYGNNFTCFQHLLSLAGHQLLIKSSKSEKELHTINTWQTIRIFNGCEVIENSITRVTVRHHQTCRVMPNSYPSDAKQLPEWRTEEPLWILFLAYSSFDNCILSILR